MLIILNSLKNLFLTITHNANYINLFGTIIAAFISYKTARYTASRPNKIKVKQLQLSNVYLPLFRMFESVPDDLTLQKAVYLHKKITNILDKNNASIKANEELIKRILEQQQVIKKQEEQIQNLRTQIQQK